MQPIKCVSLAAGLVLTLPGVAWAQELPDPATIELPDMSGYDDPTVAKQGYKFFYFHNPNVTFAEAHHDLVQCRSHLARGGWTKLPSFIPFVEDRVVATKREATPLVNNFGLVGAVFAAIILPKAERGARNNTLRICMEPRGYDRYPVPEAAWEKLNEGEEDEIVMMQAKLASGPIPSVEKVTE